MKFGSLFSGIGGLDLGLERAGMQCAWQVEIDDYCTKILSKHWPKVPKYKDIRDCGRHNLETVDLICGGFPCQPVSLAGRRQAQADPRWLWPEFARIIRELQPRYVLVENVPGLYTAGGSEVLADLAESGYDAEWDAIPAAVFGAPHLRYRILIVAYTVRPTGRGERDLSGNAERQGWGTTEAGSKSLQPEGREAHHPDSQSPSTIMAHSPGQRRGPERPAVARETEGGWPFGELGRTGDVADANAAGLALGQSVFGYDGKKCTTIERDGWWDIEPSVGRVAHGVPARVDRLRALGNAVVPQVAEWIGRRIVLHERL